MVFRSEDNMIVKGTIINRSFNKKTKDSALFLVLIKCLFFFLCVPIQLWNLNQNHPKWHTFFICTCISIIFLQLKAWSLKCYILNY